MIVISNATPLIGLAMAECFDLLRQLFGEIYIARGVQEEVVSAGKGRFGANEVEKASWIRIVEVQDQLAVEVLRDELDRGEAETVVLARELNADLVLMDERLARRKLEALGIPKMGTLGILLRAKELGLIETVRPYLEKLQARGFRFSKRVYESVLFAAGEP